MRDCSPKQTSSFTFLYLSHFDGTGYIFGGRGVCPYYASQYICTYLTSSCYTGRSWGGKWISRQILFVSFIIPMLHKFWNPSQYSDLVMFLTDIAIRLKDALDGVAVEKLDRIRWCFQNRLNTQFAVQISTFNSNRTLNTQRFPNRRVIGELSIINVLITCTCLSMHPNLMLIRSQTSWLCNFSHLQICFKEKIKCYRFRYHCDIYLLFAQYYLDIF